MAERQEPSVVRPEPLPHDAAPGRRPDPYLLALLAVAVAAGAIRSLGIGGSFGGFHGFNEAFYALQGIEHLRQPWWQPWLSPTDFMNPPLFTMALSATFGLLGVSETAARLVPIAFSVIGVFYLGLLGGSLYSRRTGLVAASLMAVTPASVLVGRNVQIEALFVALVLAAAYHFHRSRQSGSVAQGALAGVLMGASILAKLPGALALGVLIGLEAWRERGVSWMRERATLAFLGATLCVAAPWFVLQLVRNADQLLAATAGRVAGGETGFFRLPDADFLWHRFLPELAAMFSPLPAIAALAGVVLLLRRRTAPDRLVLGLAGAFLVFCLFFRKHSYYLVPIVPFASLALAELVVRIGRSWLRLAATGALVAVLAFYSTLMLGGHKLGRNELAAALGVIPEGPGVTLETMRSFAASYGAIVSYYRPQAQLRHDAAGHFPGWPVFYLGGMHESQLPWFPGALMARSEVLGLTLFGFTFYQVPPNVHFFQNGPIVARRADGVVFGLERLQLPSGVMVLDGRMPYFGNYDPEH